MELQLTTRRWTIRTKPAKPSAPTAAPYPMRVDARPGFLRTARPKDVR